MQKENFYIISGGPGSGKSTLLEVLTRAGYATMPEAGRSIIRLQQNIGGTGVPWNDRMLYTELMLLWELRSYTWACNLPGPVFFDRGIPDLLGYMHICGITAPTHIQKAAVEYRYAKCVFMAPAWPEIYVRDAERKQSWQEARATCDCMREAYVRLGYDIVELPKADVKERVACVLANIIAI